MVMAMLGQSGRCCFLLLVLTLMSVVAGEVLLIHESGKGTSWGYTHLPSTFPLTWSQARSACEAVPGSMLARVDGWQAEAAVEEYLREAAFTEPVWLANRQTLPEVLADEQREMNHIANAGVLGSDLNMGGDVGVTLRCAVYRAGVGLVHELCSEAAVSAAMCVQRLSSERALLKECPASPHRQWLMVNSHTETTTSQSHQTSVSVIGLHQCHHHHHHHGHLVRAACRPKEGWELTTCAHETPTSKHQQKNKKKSRTSSRQQSEGSSSLDTPVLAPTDERDYEREHEDQQYLSMFPRPENRRRKRSQPQSTSERQVRDVTPLYIRSDPTHQSVIENQEPGEDDKVVRYITGYKKSKSEYEKQNKDGEYKKQNQDGENGKENQDGEYKKQKDGENEKQSKDTVQPTHTHTQNEKYNPESNQHDTSASRLKDKHSNKAKSYNPETEFDPIMNEIETEVESDHNTNQETRPPSESHDEGGNVSEIKIKTTVQTTKSSESKRNEEIEPSFESHDEREDVLQIKTTMQSTNPSESQKNHEKTLSSSTHDDESEDISEMSIKTTNAQPTNPSESQTKEETKPQKTTSTKDSETITVGSGPIFVHEPDAKNETNNTDKNFRALIFPDDPTFTNSTSQNQLPDDKKDRVTPSEEGSQSDVIRTTSSKETTTIPSRPIVFPRAESDDSVPVIDSDPDKVDSDPESVDSDPSFNETPVNKTQSPTQPSIDTTKSEANIDTASEVQISESTTVDDEMKTDLNDSKNDKTEDHNTQGGSDTNTPRLEESIKTTITPSTTIGNEMKTDLNDSKDDKTEDHNTQEGSDTNTPRPKESKTTTITPSTTIGNVRQEATVASTLPSVTTEKPKSQGTRLLITQIIKNIFG